jgi:photosystem II stability/assembly factor-like uncharacterized protein
VTWTERRDSRCWSISLSPTGGVGAELLATFPDGLFASTDGGETFDAVALPSAPARLWTRLVVDRVATAPDVTYVFGATDEGTSHLWRRAGTTWTKLTPPVLSTSQSWYDWYVAAPPDNVNQVFLGAIDGYRGDFVGARWRWTDITTRGATSIHPDQHCLAFSPASSSVLLAGNDGGLFRSPDSGTTWTALNSGLAITEIEYLAADPNDAGWIMAGTQDNGTIRSTDTTAFHQMADGDGGDCGVNPLNPNEIYHSFFKMSLAGSTDKGNTWTSFDVPQMTALWYPPVSVYGRTVMIAGRAVAVTRTGGGSWTTVGLGLDTDMATASCILDADTFYVGMATGRAFRIHWVGSRWRQTELTSPFEALIKCIALDPSDPQRLWVTSTSPGPHPASDRSGGIVKRTDDGGASWTTCTDGLPELPFNAVVVDPADSRRVWVAADVGVYQSRDMGASWSPFSTGLPNAIVADLLFHKKARKLFCGTRSRGIWVAEIGLPKV